MAVKIARTSSNPRNQATVQDGRVVVQNVHGRQNRGQGNNAQGAGAAGYGGSQNRVGNANPGQARQIKCYNCNGRQVNAVDKDVDEPPVQDLALNVDNVFQADDCDDFDSDVDEAPTAQTMFMANLSSTDPVYDEAGPSYDSDVVSEVHDNDHYQDAIFENHEVHEMHDDVQPNYVVNSHADYTSVVNMIHMIIIFELTSPSSQSGFTARIYYIQDNPFAPVDNNPLVNVFAPEHSSEASSSGDVSSAKSTHVSQPHHHLGKWSKDYPFDNVIGNPSRLVSTRKQLATNTLWC
ncbi:hypothetical protein Tco_1316828 [Tanacetum coccineum]